MAADWEDRLVYPRHCRAEVRVRRLRKTIFTPRTQRGDHGAAMKVLNGLRPGLDEKIYENSLMLELIPRSSGRAAATFPRRLSW